MSTTTHATITPEPIVRLENYFREPYNLAIATARTCYSSKVIGAEDVGKDEKSREQRDRIAESIYKAGHHTTIQHPTFQFVLEKVSRQFIWSFLHAHTFYNCVARDTSIPNFHGNERPWTIEELFLRWHDPEKRHYVEKMPIRSVDEAGNLVPNKIKEVICSGPKQLYKVTTLLGYTIRSTLEHYYRRPDGSWSTLAELSVGESVLVHGTRLYKDRAWLEQQYHTAGLTQRQMAILAQTTPHTIRKWIVHFRLQKPMGSRSRGVPPPNKGRTKADDAPLARTSEVLLAMGHRPPRNGEKQLNSNWKGRSVENPRDRAKLWYKAEQCMVCGCSRSERRIERHHINNDIYNNDPENILILCSICHKAAESPYRKIRRVIADQIISIEPDGFDDTFDLAMEGPYHNFIADGFVVHNSEQVSQRYVEVKPENFAVPPLSDEARAIYVQTCHLQMDAYHRLIELVGPVVSQEYRRLFPSRRLEEKRWGSAVKKRCQEVARYVLPVATHAHLYHTISGLTLHRYWRLCQQFDAPLEQRLVVQRMVEEVTKIDPAFMALAEEPMPLEQTVEYQVFEQFHGSRRNGASVRFIEEFDQSLDGRCSMLVDHASRAEVTMAQAVRSMLGLTRDQLVDAEAIRLVLDPSSNHYLAESLTLTTMSKLSRAMVHPHFTFRKKLSHTADSQDQRHRMVPASRPILASHVVPGRPDYILPPLVAASAEAQALYVETMAKIWLAIERLLDLGVPEEHALYLLPNAFPIRFEESGDLLHFHHKWVQRLCYTAQEEIWSASRQEVEQVEALFPEIGRFLRAPCWVRAEASVKPICPEGDRFCGVAVWKQPLAEYQRLI